jgi:hypothetical protein
MKNNTQYKKHIYWFPHSEFVQFENDVKSIGFELKSARKTSCGTLNAKGNTVRYASPEIFNGLCGRQGSWYRESNRSGSYLVVSEEKLPEEYNQFLDAIFTDTDFSPQSLPSQTDIQELVDSEEYQSQHPEDWEKKTFTQGLMYKVLFVLTGFWGFGDSLNKHWNNHRANHANFLTHEYTTNIDGEDVPYSVTDNDGVCSSCVEFFNIIDQDSRKMVRACPGAVYFSSVEGKKYYDIQPVKFTPSTESE